MASPPGPSGKMSPGVGVRPLLSSPARLLSPLLLLLPLFSPLLLAGVVADAVDCRYFHVETTDYLVMREFLFMAHTTLCVNVKVYWSQSQPGPSEVDLGSLDASKWSLMCDADVNGQGSASYTVLPESNCTAVHAPPGTTVWFYFGIEETTGCSGGAGGGWHTAGYEVLERTYSMSFDTCPANHTATLEEVVEAQGVSPRLPPPAPTPEFVPLGPYPTPFPTSAPTVSEMPSEGPHFPTSVPTASTRPSAGPTRHPSTLEPTISEAPVTSRPTRSPITSKPTQATRYTLTSTTEGGGNIDPGHNETRVDPGTTVTFYFYPDRCLLPDNDAGGILYGHFDADFTIFDGGEFPIAFTPGTVPPDTGSFSYPTGTDSHEHEYDDECDCVYVDYVTNDIMKPASFYIPDDKVFKMVAINGDINTAGFFAINDIFDHDDPSTYTPVVLWDDVEFDDLPAFTFGDPTDSQWNPSMTNATLRSSVTRLSEFSMGYKKDAIYRGPGGILPSNTGDIQSNQPGQHGEWRNGGLTMQMVEVDPVDLSNHCQMQPLWSNASVGGLPTSPRSPQGPVYNCSGTYTVLYEATLFWHWNSQCDCGGDSYHKAEWPASYECFFETDCSTGKAGDSSSTCVNHKLCHALVDGQAVPVIGGMYTLENIREDHDVRAVFVPANEACPPLPSSDPTSSPTVSAAPTPKPTAAPTAGPTVSVPPTAGPTAHPSVGPSLSLKPSSAPTALSPFERDVLAALDDSTTFEGRCWRWAHTWSCDPGGQSCRYLTGADADDVARTSVTGEGGPADDGCCPESSKVWAGRDSAESDCIDFQIMGVSNLGPQDTCLGPEYIHVSEGKVRTNETLLIPNQGNLDSYIDGFAVNVSVSSSSVCSSCWLSSARAWRYETNKGDAPYNQCPGQSGNEPWGTIYNSFNEASFSGKLAKHYTFVYKYEKRFPYAFAADVWCGNLDGTDGDKNAQGCQPLAETYVNRKDKDWQEAG